MTMPKYNDSFKLSVKDIELIERALRSHIQVLAQAHLAGTDRAAEADEVIRDYQEVLGKLHNQKIWYGQTHATGVPLG
jgi:hypothetical protein